MTKYSIKIENLPPMPRNRSHSLVTVKNRVMNIKTPLARMFELDLYKRLDDRYLNIQKELKKAFNPRQNFLSVNYVIFTPLKELITSQGSINSRAVDTDAHKLFQDVIFKFLELDDKYVREAYYFTPKSTDGNWNYLIEINIKNIAELLNETCVYRF